MAINIFQDPTKSIPKKSQNIVRVSMDEIEIGGRKDCLPKADSNEKMAIQHTTRSA